MENELLTELEQKIGYQFKDKGLLKHAMSHSSYANERHMGKLRQRCGIPAVPDAIPGSGRSLLHPVLQWQDQPVQHLHIVDHRRCDQDDAEMETR